MLRDNKYYCLNGIYMPVWKYGPWLFERKAIKTNNSGKPSVVYYAPDGQRTKNMNLMEADDSGRWNIVGKIYNGDPWLHFTD